MPFVLAGLIVILVVLIILGGLESKPANDNAGQNVADAGTRTNAQDKPVDWKNDGVDINQPDKKEAHYVSTGASQKHACTCAEPCANRCSDGSEQNIYKCCQSSSFASQKQQYKEYRECLKRKRNCCRYTDPGAYGYDCGKDPDVNNVFCFHFLFLFVL